MPVEFWELSKYGAEGVIIALIFVIILCIAFIYKIAKGFTKVITNHISHETEAKVALAKSIQNLSNSVDGNTKSTDRLEERMDRSFNGRK